MCRYAMYGPYKAIFACFPCRKSFKIAPQSAKQPSSSSQRIIKCPQCGEEMNDRGHDFKAPKQTDLKQWLKVEILFKNGFAYHSCGCGGPGYRPAQLSEVEAFVQNHREFKSEGELLLPKLSMRSGWHLVRPFCPAWRRT